MPTIPLSTEDVAGLVMPAAEGLRQTAEARARLVEQLQEKRRENLSLARLPKDADV